jgi:hypothetical protein
MHSAGRAFQVAPLAAAVVAVSSLTPLAWQSKPQVFPVATWAKWDRPEDANYKPARLDAVRAWLMAGQTKALFVAVDGKELFSYGDVTAANKVRRFARAYSSCSTAATSRKARSTSRRPWSNSV